MDGVDPSLLQDFLTESGELIDQLDSDLVKLETADEVEQKELLNSCFRALHTIKGAASFLNLESIIRFAHAPEDALNRMRKGEIPVTDVTMDVLLQSADVVRRMIDDLGQGREVEPAPEPLMASIKELVDAPASAGLAEAAAEPLAVAVAEEVVAAGDGASGGGTATKPLTLGEQKLDLLDFMVTDLKETVEQLDEAVAGLGNDATRADAAEHLVEIGDSLVKTAAFFELDDLSRLVSSLFEKAEKFKSLEGAAVDEVMVRVRAIAWLVERSAEALTNRRALDMDVDGLVLRLKALADGEAIEDVVAGKHGGEVKALLLLDGVLTEAQYGELSGDAVAEVESAISAVTENLSEVAAAVDSAALTEAAAASAPAKAPEAAGGKSEPARAAAKPVAEQTIRVEVGRLESLLNLVGQLVLNKNRLLGLTRTIRDSGVPQELAENFAGASGELDQLMGELQMGVMRTRMQPLAKLFDRYPRVIRDVARTTGKKIRLDIEGKDTEVDKSVLEQLSDPLVHILRNSADHGVESIEDRKAQGKPEEGVIRLVAEHQGSHVRIAIIDDGKGLDREVLGAKAVERGLVTEDALATMEDEDVFRFIFQAGFSTAKAVSDLSGRGVGMDVVRTNVEKINGTINISSKKGEGTTMEILIPLTVAIMPAMVTGVGGHLYAIPLQSIVEIVRPDEHGRHTVKGQEVIRLRDTVLPLIDMVDCLGERRSDDAGRFAVVIGVGNQRAGLLVDRLVGQQEIVIKPLDDGYTQGGPFSGATIQEDGEVSLILDVAQVLRYQKPVLEQMAA
ncbi:chemotaxis protein CheA [Mucisphaera sp.]|uniref:chemotaxis protein CheA n=1 Tax=Mucisphaera sp. TaxID=2913024 RepID=UPI003D10DC7A